MARSAKKLRRLAALFRDIATNERAAASELARRIDEAKAAQEHLLKTLGSPSESAEPFIGLMSRSVSGIEQRLKRLNNEYSEAMRRYREASARADGGDALFEAASASEERKAEQRALEDLIEFQQATARARSG
jgi:rubrerythrin